MRYIVGFLIFCILSFSCKSEDAKVNYLQIEDVQLVQPRIIASNTVIDSFVTVKTDRNIEGVSIYYSEDGSEPSITSTKFTGEIVIDKPNELKFKAFHNNFKASETAILKLYKNGHTASSIEWFTSANDKYNGSGINTVINGKKATLEYSNPQWTGFDTIAKAFVKFDKKTKINSIDIGYLNDPGSWIFPPSAIEVIVNENKNELITFQLEPIEVTTTRAMLNFKVPINREVSTLIISVKNVQQIPDWHDGKGSNAWLFMDEWIFN